MSKDYTGYWQEEIGEEWVNFVEGVPLDIVLETSEPEEIQTTWGAATVLRVWQYNQGQLKGGIRKLLRINSKRLRRGLRNASIGGVPAKGNGYTLIRRGESWSTTYNVSWLGKYKIYPQTGAREELRSGSKTLDETTGRITAPDSGPSS